MKRLVSTLDALDLDEARRFFDLRYFGALTAAQASAPHLRPGGSITLTTGGALGRPRPGWSVAVSVLGAVDALTRA
ncbi:MAG: short-chain dehydrogenase, partial [Verrucomicrobiota bacterium]